MRRFACVGLCWGLVVIMAAGAAAQLSSEDIAALRAQGEREGWTFTVSENPATQRPLEELCGFVVPDNWWVGAKFDPCTPTRSLPAAFDWRDYGACPPVRNQGNCGSCWAFGTVGPLESNIIIKDGIVPDLSEQWLVSCNSDGWGCNGGFWAHDYHEWKPDPCGGKGAVLEADFPYVAANVPCNCPYNHPYLIQDWAYIGNSYSVPPTDSIKQAILDYGPVSAAVYVNSAFQAYSGGIFNGCTSGTVNHAVVLVGWNDNGGYWIMRNSWGPNWGEGGYMRIPYGCSSIGYAACYVVYPGMAGLEVSPADGLVSQGDPGGPFTPSSITYTLRNPSALGIDYSVTKTAPWLTITNPNGHIGGNGTVYVTVSINENANSLGLGRYTDTINFVNLTNHRGDTTRPVKLEVGAPIRLYRFTLDNNPGWTTQGEWAFGQPTGQGGTYGFPDPAAGATGTNVYGVNLDGDYSTTYGGPYYLTMGPLNFSQASGGTLYFQRWLNTDYQPYVTATVEASHNGTDWVQLWSNGKKVIKENSWSLKSYDLPAVIDHQPTVYVRWGYRIGVQAQPYSGWNIDDIEIWAFAPPPTDCNGNGIDDATDIASGTSYDDNENVVPDECEKLAGDLNCDGHTGFADINPFVLLMTDPSAYLATYPDCIRINGDINGDGTVGFADINLFVSLIAR